MTNHPDKSIVKDDRIAPFTIERTADEKIELREFTKVMKLGPVASKWLLEALQLTTKNFYTSPQAIHHNGKVVLQVLNESGYIFVIGTNVRFLMKRDVVLVLVDIFRRILDN